LAKSHSLFSFDIQYPLFDIRYSMQNPNYIISGNYREVTWKDVRLKFKRLNTYRLSTYFFNPKIPPPLLLWTAEAGPRPRRRGERFLADLLAGRGSKARARGSGSASPRASW